jgi:WD40 repeat protein
MKKSALFFFLSLLFQLVQAQKPYVLLKTLNNHNAPIECLVVAPDGKTALTADQDGYIVFWDIVDSMKMLYKVKGHTGGINCVLFNKSGTKFVTAGDDYKIKLWNYETRKPINSYLSPYNSVNFAVLSPDERSIYFGGYRRASSNSFIQSGQFTGLYQVNVDGNSDAVLLYNDEGDNLNYYSTNTWGITDGNLDASRKYVVYTKGYYVYFWDIKENRLAFKRSTTINLNNLYCTNSYIYLWGDGYISKLSVNDNYSVTKTYEGANDPANSGYSKFAFSKSGKYMITGDDDTRVNIWNTSTGSKVQVLSSHTDIVRTFAFGYNDSLIVTAGYDGAIKIWGYQEIKDRLDSLENLPKDTLVAVVRDTVTIQEDTLHVVLLKDSIYVEKDTVPVVHEVIFTENNIPVKIKDRDVELQSTITVNKTEFDIEIWDRSVVDGDSISLNLNGNWILQEYMVVKTKLTLHVKIDPNATNNYLILFAHNLGEISPNTAAVQVLIDGKEYKLTLTSDLKKSGALNFAYKP